MRAEIKAIYIAALKFNNSLNKMPEDYVDNNPIIFGKGAIKKRISFVEIRDFLKENNIRSI